MGVFSLNAFKHEGDKRKSKWQHLSPGPTEEQHAIVEAATGTGVLAYLLPIVRSGSSNHSTANKALQEQPL
jgi:Rad3-related DNA helicase